MSVSAALKSRVRRPSYLSKIAKAEDLLHHFPNGAYVGWSGFTGVGYPKYVQFPLLQSSEAFPAILGFFVLWTLCGHSEAERKS